MNLNKISTLGAYIMAFLDSAATRGELTPASAQTLLNGLVEIYHDGNEHGFSAPKMSGFQTPMIGSFPSNVEDPEFLSRITDELLRRQRDILGSTENKSDSP